MTTRPAVLVTGAGRGLGRRTAEIMSEHGWQVLLGCREPLAGERLAGRLRAEGGSAHPVPLDVTDAGSVDAAVPLVSRLAGGKLHALVNNAGVFLDEADEHLGTLSATECRNLFAVNAIGPLLVTQAFTPLLQAARSAAVVNISSDDADPENADGTYTGYRMSKAALNAMTENLALALAQHGIVVNTVYPGWIPTDMGGPEAPDDLDAAAELVARAAELAVATPDARPTGQIFWATRKDLVQGRHAGSGVGQT